MSLGSAWRIIQRPFRSGCCVRVLVRRFRGGLSRGSDVKTSPGKWNGWILLLPRPRDLALWVLLTPGAWPELLTVRCPGLRGSFSLVSALITDPLITDYFPRHPPERLLAARLLAMTLTDRAISGLREAFPNFPRSCGEI